MSSLSQSVENLHLRAIEQRNQLHQTTAELKEKIVQTRERFDIPHNLRQHFAAAALIAAAAGLLSGYSLGGMLARQ